MYIRNITMAHTAKHMSLDCTGLCGHIGQQSCMDSGVMSHDIHMTIHVDGFFMCSHLAEVLSHPSRSHSLLLLLLFLFLFSCLCCVV